MEKLRSFLKTFLRTLKNCLKIEFTSMPTVLFFYTVTRVFLDGMEEFLILPTAWYYIASFGQTKFFLGVTLSAYSFGVMVFAPIFARLDYRLRATKTILVLCAVTRFLANLLYSIPVSEYFPLFGRLISGIAGGSVGVLYGLVTKYTDNKNRAKAFLIFEGLFNVGKSLAPTIGSFVTFDVNIFGWKIGPGNSPGFILAISWFFMIFLTLCLPRNLGHEDSFSSCEEIQLDSKNDDGVDLESKLKPNNPLKQIDSKISCLYFMVFVALLVSCIVSFYTPLIAVYLVNLKLIHVKVLFLNGMLAVLIGYLANYLASEYVSEINLVVVWLALQIFPIILMYYFALTWNNANPVFEPYLLLFFISLGLMLSFNYPLISSLLSKVTDINHAAFYQSLCSTVVHFAVVTSRLLAGLTFTKTSMTSTCIMLTCVWIFQVVWFSAEYRRLIKTKKTTC